MNPGKKTAKNINIKIQQADTYNYHAYSHSSAKLEVMVISLADRKMDTILLKKYSVFRLRNLPGYSKGFEQNIVVPAVADKTEKIILIYTVIYNSGGHVLSIPSVNYIGKGATKNDFVIII